MAEKTEEEHIQEQILNCVSNEYKDVVQIAKELNVSRNRVQVHVFKMRKQGKITRAFSDDERVGRKGFKFKRVTPRNLA